jgi:chromosome segregation ATPase
VNKEIEALKKAKADMEEELKNQKNQSSKDKEKLNYEINKLDGKISKLNKEKDKLVKNNEKYKEKFESLENDIRDLRESLEKEKDKNNLKDMDIPEGVKVNQWYPEKLVSLPDKKTYDDGEDIDMTGMKMRFARVIKRNGQYIRETEDVDYKDFKSSYRGWEFNLKTKTAKYDESTQGKMKIIYTFILKHPNQSW